MEVDRIVEGGQNPPFLAMSATCSTKCLKEADLVCGRRPATGTTNGGWTAEEAQAGIPEVDLGRCRSGSAGGRPILASPALFLAGSAYSGQI